MTDRTDPTELNQAIANDDIELVRHLIEKGDVDLSLWGNENPLIVAVQSTASYELIKLLIDSGADVDGMDFEEYTALRCALDDSRDIIVELLVDEGADPTIQDIAWSKSPLHLIYKLEDKNLVRILRKMLLRMVFTQRLSYIDDGDSNGMTPYETLYVYKDRDPTGQVREALKLLELYGAKPFNSEGKTPSLFTLSLRSIAQNWVNVSALPDIMFP